MFLWYYHIVNVHHTKRGQNMKIAAIIAEYNPFHKGHKYQLDEIRKETGAEYIIAIMSGDFTQRGEPAIFPKEMRAKAALKAGVDAVFLLPVTYSTAGAELFAKGAVSIALGLGADTLCFGSESGNIDELLSAAMTLRQSGTIESEKIKNLMWEGNTFARARAIAFPEYEKLLSTPNNVLGIEYIIAGMSMSAPLKYYTHKRVGSEHNGNDIVEDSEYQNASTIRRLISEHDKAKLEEYLPSEMLEVIDESESSYVLPDDFSDILYTKLLFLPERTEYFEVSENLLNRIKGKIGEYSGFEAYAELINTKNTTHAGVKRALLHILLGLQAASDYRKKTDKITHVRMLGFKKDAAALLTEISKTGRIKSVTKVPSAANEFNTFTKTLFEEDLNAATIYEYVKSRKNGEKPVHDYSKPIAMI